MTRIPTDSFVPLPGGSPTTRDRQDFRVLVVERPENARPFHGEDVASPAAPAAPAPGAAPAPSRPGCEPRVSLQREGDRVTGIHIQCSCGQVIDLACVYGG
jgi:hypothetical protein